MSVPRHRELYAAGESRQVRVGFQRASIPQTSASRRARPTFSLIIFISRKTLKQVTETSQNYSTLKDFSVVSAREEVVYIIQKRYKSLNC
jgi:hypothetical protein